MKTFATKEKRSAPAARKARPYVHHSMGPAQKAQQTAMRKILRPDEIQAKPDIGENDNKHEQEADHVAAELHVAAISGIPPSESGGAPAIQRSENEEPDEEIQRQPEEEEDEPIQTKLIQRQPEEEEKEPIQAKLIQRQADNEEEKEPIQAKGIRRKMADMREIHPSRFGYVGPEVKAQQTEIHSILRSTGMQAKLTIGQPNDKYEQEADRVADQVMSAPQEVPLGGMPEPKRQRQPENEEEEETLQTKPLADQITPLVQRQEENPEEEEEESVQTKDKGEVLQRMCSECEEEMVQRQSEELQTKAKSVETKAVAPNIESRINNLKGGGGQRLDHATRSFFEPRIGYDFDHVRVHADGNASELARSVNARAFTFNNNIVMGSGEYQPKSDAGRRLLGHELAHVVQQSAVHKYDSSIVPRAATSSVVGIIQRLCGPDIPDHRGSSTRMTGEEEGTRVLFNVNCDTFRPGHHTFLQSLAPFYRNSDAVLEIHGYASEEGGPVFNERLSCQRAIVARRVLHAEGVPWHRIRLYHHGGTPGDRDEHRSVVITQIYVHEPIDPYGTMESTAMIFPWTRRGVETLLSLDSEGQQTLTAMEGMGIVLCDSIESERIIWDVTDPTGNVTFDDILEGRVRPTITRSHPTRTFNGFYLPSQRLLHIRSDMHNLDAAGVLRHEATHRYEERTELEVRRETTAWRRDRLSDVGLTEDQFESKLPSVDISDERRQAAIGSSQAYSSRREGIGQDRYRFTRVIPVPVGCTTYSRWGDLPVE